MRARLFILPWSSKQISARIWVLAFFRSLHSSCQAPNVPDWDHLSRVDNPGRSVPTAMYRVECPMIKAGQRWSNMISTRDFPDDLNSTPMTLFALSRKEYLEVYYMLKNSHRYQASTKIPKPSRGISFSTSSFKSLKDV